MFRSRVLSGVRLALFAAAVVAISMGLGRELRGHIWIPTTVGLGVAFGLVARRHETWMNRQGHVAELRRTNERGLLRIARDWPRLPPAPPSPLAEGSSLAKDLSLFGNASLSQLLGTVATPAGHETLARWLLTAAPKDVVLARQEEVRRRVPRLFERQELEVAGRLANASNESLTRFLDWAEAEPARPPGTAGASLALVCVLSIATIPSCLLALAGRVPHAVPLSLLFVNFLVSSLLVPRLREEIARAGRRRAGIDGLAPALRLVASASAETSCVASGIAALRRLGRILRAADLRFNEIVYLPVQMLTLWDFHVAHALRSWKRSFGTAARSWFDALGREEALSALAALSFENPSWAFPVVGSEASNAGPRLVAKGLGHPLLAGTVRVGNDVEVGPPGTFVLLTGSNMSGKSTLLRSIGLNVVLAQAGGPVAAKAMSLPEVSLTTSLQIEDSLADGVSFFLAELKRLKEIVEDARRCQAMRAPVALYLLDEVLRGTNSKDRQHLARRVLRFLLGSGAIGVVSTHDLSLVDLEELRPARRDFHFRETLETSPLGTRMSFDYRLRPGVSTTSSAEGLLEVVGLDLSIP